MVSALIDYDTKRLKSEVIRTIFLPFEANTILNIPLSYNLPEDKLIWMGNKKGEFTVKSAYYVALSLVETKECGECSNGDQRNPLWRKIWHLKIPTKIRTFAWRAYMNGLPTKLNLCRKGVNISPMCPMCKQEPESISHTLLHCDFAKQVWDKWKVCLINLRLRQGDFTNYALQMLNTGAT